MPKNPVSMASGLLFGKKKKGIGAYQSPYAPAYDQGVYGAVAGRAGARGKKDPQTGQMTYDYSKSFRDPSRSRRFRDYQRGETPNVQFDPNQARLGSGLKAIRGQYNMGGFDQARRTLTDPRFGKFDFKGLPEEYGQRAYAGATRGMARESDDALSRIQRAMGTRRPGMLAQVAQESQRDLARDKGALREQIALDEMRQRAALDQRQQELEAQYDVQRAQMLPQLDVSQAGLESQLLGQERGLAGQEYAAGMQGRQLTGQELAAEREYQDRALQYLMNALAQATGGQQRAAQIARSGGERDPSIMQGVGKIAGSIASGFI
jgi:hypothetical protein